MTSKKKLFLLTFLSFIFHRKHWDKSSWKGIDGAAIVTESIIRVLQMRIVQRPTQIAFQHISVNSSSSVPTNAWLTVRMAVTPSRCRFGCFLVTIRKENSGSWWYLEHSFEESSYKISSSSFTQCKREMFSIHMFGVQIRWTCSVLS